jgi:hypothetical protein
MLTDQQELEKVLTPILRENGSEIPAPGCYVAAVEFDEAGQVVAYQIIQNAIFFEGLWARDHSAHLHSVFNMAIDFAENTLGAKNPLTLTRNDEQGNRIGRLIRRFGFKQKDWNIHRREQ